MFLLASCHENVQTVSVEQWTTHEIAFAASNSYENGYMDVDLDIVLINDTEILFCVRRFGTGVRPGRCGSAHRILA